MTAFQVARFGNRANAHDLLGHSGVSKEVLSTIVWRTDAPPNSEGLGLEPFVAAYRLGMYYVLHATSIDVDAPRAGMVVTTAAVVPLESLADLDICALWSALFGNIDVNQPLNSADYVLPSIEDHAHAPGAKAAASSLIEASRVVWVGPGFEDFVGCLWRHLRPRDRERLVVAAAGHPDRIPIAGNDASLTAIKSSSSVVGRWSDWTAAAQTTVEGPDVVRDALFGDDQGRAEGLAKRLGVAPEQIEFNTWRHLANAARLFQDLANLDHGRTRTLLQLLGLVQPAPDAGLDVKGVTLDRLRDLSKNARFADMRGLRGIPWNSLVAGARPPMIQAWATAVTKSDSRVRDVVVASAELSAVEETDDFLAEIGGALAAGLKDKDVVRLCKSALALSQGEKSLAWLSSRVCTIDVLDDAVFQALEAGTVAPEWLLGTAKELRLPVTLATSLPADNPVAAWTSLIALASSTTLAEDLLETRTGPRGLVEAALAVPHAGLVERASRAVVRDTSLLSGGSVKDPAFRNIWFAAARLGADPWAVVRPSDTVVPLLDLLLEGDFVEPSVLLSLSQTTAADISAHGSRRQLWSKIPPDAVSGFKNATAESIARSFQSGHQTLEPELAGAVLAAPLLASVASESAGQALELLAGVASARATDAVVVANHGRFTDVQSKAFGTLVKNRGWRSAADTIIKLSASRSDLINAATTVSGMFGFFDRIARIMSAGSPVSVRVSTDELKSSILTVAASLYGQGPTTDAVWERAGGDEADLITGRTGRLAWGHGIEASLAGRRGAPTIEQLVAVMLDDYPRDARLLTLKRTIENGLNF